MTESQIKYMNKVKLISFIILVIGLLLVLAFSIIYHKKPAETEELPTTLAINYEANGEAAKYDFTCATQDCVLSSQAGVYALVKDGSYKLVSLTNGTTKELNLPTINSNFMVADENFYGIVYTKDETNKASFYDSETESAFYEDDLDYQKMNTEEVQAVLSKMYPRKLFYIIKEELGSVVNYNTNEIVLDNVKGIFYYENELYAINDKGLNLFKEDGTVSTLLTDTKEVYNAIYKDKIVVLSKANKIKVATLKGELGADILDLGENKVDSMNVTNGILRIILQDKDYATNQKLIKYEYDFENNKLNTVE